MNNKIAVTWLSLVILFSLVVIIVDIAPKVEGPSVLEVDDSGGKPYTSIQAAVDDAQPGDTVFVYNGTYYEDVEINKTINLTGESRDNTIINGSGTGWCVYGHNADYINITEFTMENGSTGLSLAYSNNSLAFNNKIVNTGYGIILSYSTNVTIDSNVVLSSFNLGIEIFSSSFNWIVNNTSSNKGHGIRLFSNSIKNNVTGNKVISNIRGIILTVGSDGNNISDNTIESNTEYGIRVSNSNQNFFINNTLSNNQVGVRLSSTNGTNVFINGSIFSSTNNDVEAGSVSNDIFLNTSFNKTRSYFYDIISKITVQWFLHINVTDFLGNPIPNAKVKIEDNTNGSYYNTFTTDINGQIKWLPITEYIEQDLDGDEIGNKTYYTPHKIVAWNDTLVGYAQSFINESKTVTIILYNGTLIDLEPGWNLVSLPRIQSNTNIETVFQSINGSYNSVWRYNITDYNDQWKHYHISKPSYFNDLKEINHTMGLWVHVTDPGGTTLVVFGDVLTSTQNISLYPGWNLVGYPSTTDKIRISALNNIFFDTDVDAIWTYNATTPKWKEITASDNFEIGRGYWIHSKVTKTWIVPI